MKEQISYDIFNKVDIRIGTVLSVKKNAKAKKPSLIIEVDFGNEIGVKQSSAQITHYYNEQIVNENLNEILLYYTLLNTTTPQELLVYHDAAKMEESCV